MRLEFAIIGLPEDLPSLRLCDLPAISSRRVGL
jgi:hypothetical protein